MHEFAERLCQLFLDQHLVRHPHTIEKTLPQAHKVCFREHCKECNTVHQVPKYKVFTFKYTFMNCVICITMQSDLPNELCDRTVNHFFSLFSTLSRIFLSLLASNRAILISCATIKAFLLLSFVSTFSVLLLVFSVFVSSFRVDTWAPRRRCFLTAILYIIIRSVN